MKTIAIFIVKRYIKKALNALLSKLDKNKVLHATDTIEVWIDRLAKVIEVLKSLNCRVADGELTDDEIQDSTREITTLVEQF